MTPRRMRVVLPLTQEVFSQGVRQLVAHVILRSDPSDFGTLSKIADDRHRMASRQRCLEEAHSFGD